MVLHLKRIPVDSITEHRVKVISTVYIICKITYVEEKKKINVKKNY